MKKVFTFLMCLVLVTQVFGAMRTYERNGLYYAREDHEASGEYLAYVAGPDDEDENQSYAGLTSVVIPDTVVFDGIVYTVVGIYDEAFLDCQNLASVTFSNSLRTIGGSAFRGCTGLDSIVIPVTVKEINYDAFAECSNLVFVSVPGTNKIRDEFTIYYKGVFSDCNNLKTIAITEGTTEIGDETFKELNLTSIVIPEGVKTIGQNAFRECHNLASVSLPSTLETIGEYAFRECAFDSINIPVSVKKIGDHAFEYNQHLKTIVLQGAVEDFGNEMFSACDSLQYTEESNIKYLGNDENPYLILVKASNDYQSFEINSQTKTIADEAFNVSEIIEELTVPDSVKFIGDRAFERVKKLFYHGTATGSPWGARLMNVVTDGDFLYADSNKTILVAYNGFDSLVNIPNGVVKIDQGAFERNNKLQSVVIPNTVKNIGGWAFSDCSQLVEVTVPNSVDTIGSDAFRHVQSVFYKGTADGNPWGAQFVNPTIENGFIYTDSTKTVLAKYIGTDSVITILDGVTEIGAEAFRENRYIKSVVMDSTLVSIGDNAFYECPNLQSISLPDGLKTIGWYSFTNCGSLRTVTIPDGVETIHYAFNNGVQFLYYNGTADGYPWGARFANPIIYGDFVFADSAKTILKAYLGTDNEVVIPNGVVEIKEYAFKDNNFIKSVVITDSVKTINDGAFSYCDNLSTVSVPSSVETMGYDVFSGYWSVTVVCDFASKPDSWPDNWNGYGSTVVWKKAPFSVTISSENGTVTGFVSDSSYYYGDTLKLTAKPAKGYKFYRWSDWNDENPRTIVVNNSNIELSAEFEEAEPVSVNIRSKNTFLGTVSGFDQNKSYLEGDTLTLTATPVGKFGFEQWDDGNTDNPRTIIINGDLTLVAEFAEPFELADSCGWGSIGSFSELTKNDKGKTTQVDLSFSNSGYRWDAQFVTPSFKNLGNEGDAFELSFDVKYSGKFDEGQFTIVAGKTIPYNAEYDQANNTQIVDEDGYSLSWGREFTVEKEWTRVSYNYYLGAEGADSVRLEFDLGTHAGTYSFKNIVLKVAGNTADSWFCTGDILVNAIAENGTVTGAGFYNNGDTAVLYASANDFYIFKQWSDGNTDNPRQVIVNNDTTFTAMFVSDGSRQIPYLSKVNTWSYDGLRIDKAYVKDNIVSIFVPEFGEEWFAQFCNILTGLDGQEAGNNFQLDFDVNWNGLESDSAKIYLLAGKVTGGLHEDYQWSDSIAELVNAEGTIDGIRYAGYDIANGEWTHVSWGGIITETGAKYIGIEMNLGMTEENGDNRGTFNFKNITMTINNNMVKYNYVEDDKVIVSLSASKKNCGTLSGSGIYNAGDTVTIAATPNDGYEFKQWSDGNTDNPRAFVAAEDLWLVAQIIEIPGPYAGTATVLPGNLEAENFDNGDSTHYEIYLGTSYDGYRDTDAGIDKIGDNEYALSWTTEGEWADYTVTVAEEQKMRWAARVSTYIYDSAKVAIYKDEAPVTGTIEAPKTDSWYRYDFVSGETQFALPEGTYKLRVNFEKEDCNIDKVMFGKLSDVLVTTKIVTASDFSLPSHAAIGFVKGYGFYESGSEVTLTASAAEGYQFKQWSDGNRNATRTITVTSDTVINAIFDKAETLTVYAYSDFDEFGKWFSHGILLDEFYTNQNNEAVIKVDDAGNAWDAQFCNIFHEANGQAEGNSFSLDFDVMWEGDNADTAAINILAGKSYSNFHADYQWNSYDDTTDVVKNTELIYEGGFWAGHNKEYRLPYGQWQHVTWGGTIGEAGADYIGIQINLANADSLYIGTYRFKNVVAKMNGGIVSRSFNDPNTNLLVSASGQNGTVTGGGYYGKGDEVKLTATPNEGYLFKQWSDGNTRNPRTITVNGNMTFVAEFVVDDSNPLSSFGKTNTWFIAGTTVDRAYEKDNIASLFVSEYCDQWLAQFCNILTGLDGQEAGNNFQLDFDVNWNGLDSDKATIYLLAGKVEGGIHEDYQWSDSIAELVNAEGTIDGIRYAGYDLANSEWTHVSWGGIITETGAEYVGIEINLGMNEADGDNRGTFNFKNMKVRINGEVVKEYYSTGELFVNATAGENGTVTGAGFYAKGDTATITAKADEFYYFKQWSDGNTDNPRIFVVNDDMSLKAEFATNAVIIPYYAESDSINAWYVNGNLVKKAIAADNIASITVSENGNLWESQFCNILSGLDGQEAGSKFQLDFDVNWNSLSGADKAQIMMVTGKSGYGDRYSDDENTELVNDNGNFNGIQYATYEIANKSWTHISWGGTIGEKGADYIGVGIYFNKFDEEADKRGTFNFKNMKVRINGEVVKQDFCTGELFVNATAKNGTVTGAGYYTKGDTATLAVTPYDGCIFKQWSDGNTDNPRTFVVTDDASFVAEIEREEVNYTSADYPFNTWWTSGSTADSVQMGASGYAAKISISEEQAEGDRWDVQFCNIFHQFDGQVEGNNVKLSFDVKFEGAADTATITFVTGKITWSLDPEIHEDYQWTDDNTEIVDEYGNMVRSFDYDIEKGKWQNITIEGKIGEKGAKYIGIELDLAGNAGNTNNVGDFYFKNMTLSVNGNIVTSDYEVIENTKKSVLVIANNESYGNVSGTGDYNLGDTVTATATATDGCEFIGWSDGSTSNPYSFVVTKDVKLTANFQKKAVVVETFTVSVAADSTLGSAFGDGIYSRGDTATITAIANDGCEFIGWSDGSTSNPYSFVVTESVTLTANFQKKAVVVETFTVSVAADSTLGSAFGDGIYSRGDTATITAIANDGFEFIGWSDGSTANPYSFVVTKDVKLTANFQKKAVVVETFTVSVAADSTFGSVRGAGTYKLGDTATITAIANDDYEFTGWSDGSTANPYSFVVTKDVKLTANFQKKAVVVETFTVSVAADSTLGSVLGDGIYSRGDTATITAIANDGCEFIGWSDGSTSNPYSFVVTKDVKLTANFQKKAVVVETFAVAVTANDSTFGSVFGAGTYNLGDSVTISAVANEGYEFIGWSDGSTSNPYSFVVTESVTLTANFQKKAVVVETFTVSVAADSTFGSVLGAGTYKLGDTATIVALENDGYEFTGWSDGNTNAVRTIVVTADVKLTALFSKKFNPERTVDGLVFFLTDTTAHTADLIGLADSRTGLDAPAEIKIEGVAYQVTGIGNKAFAGCTQLDSINIPESIEAIGIEAFANCTGTVSIVIPNTVDSIGYNAFLNVKNIVYEGNATGSPWGALTVNGTFDGDYIYDTDSSLTVYTGSDTVVVIPDEVSTIGHNAFAGNETVTSIEIPETVTEIGDGAFNGCSNLESVEIPKSVESIGNETFANCTSLESVEIPESVKEIGSSAFNGCSSLTAIQIPVSVTVIGQSAFANCSKLDAVEIPESVNELGNGAFTNCTSLVSVSIPVSVTVIGAETFSGCSSLNSIDIPSATTEIGNNAFDGCSSLTTISIPVSVTTIGNGAFAYCNSLVTVQIGTFINVKNEGVSTLADGSVSIGSRAFIGCDSLTAVYIPLSVASIGDSAFAGCKNLTIYCEAESMPEGWSESWNPEGCKVVWNYNGKPQVVEFNLIAIANNSRYGSVTGSATYTKGATATITATAAEGYKFVGWSDGNTDNPRTIVVTGDLAITAVFESVTAIDDEAAAAVNIFAYSNTIVVENADSDISVYDANGRLIATAQPAGQRTEILIANKGVYLVKVGNTAKRVMVF